MKILKTQSIILSASLEANDKWAVIDLIPMAGFYRRAPIRGSTTPHRASNTQLRGAKPDSLTLLGGLASINWTSTLRFTLDSGIAHDTPRSPAFNVLLNLLYSFIKPYLDDCWVSTPALTLLPEQKVILERLLKVWNSNLYYKNSHMSFEFFCW